MTNKNKKRRTPARAGRSSARPTSGAPPAASEGRRERKEQARQTREAQRRRAERADRLRRVAVVGVAGVVAVGVFYWLQRAADPRPVPEAAVAAAEAAGCSTVASPARDAPAGQHVAEGAPITYTQVPATSGEHYGGQVLPSSPDSYDQPITSEPAAVHFLEHAGVMLYYRADGDGAAAPDVVAALEGVSADAPMTVAAPYDGLPDGTAVALAAWNQLQTCPGSITADQATAVAGGFAQAFACTSNAPEAGAADDC
jgi:hypothetical protein